MRLTVERWRRVHHTFNDIDLSALGPRAFLAEGPECGPRAAPLGHMLQVEHYDGLVVRFRGVDPDATPPSGGGRDNVLGIRAHNELVIRGYVSRSELECMSGRE